MRISSNGRVSKSRTPIHTLHLFIIIQPRPLEHVFDLFAKSLKKLFHTIVIDNRFEFQLPNTKDYYYRTTVFFFFWETNHFTNSNISLSPRCTGSRKESRGNGLRSINIPDTNPPANHRHRLHARQSTFAIGVNSRWRVLKARSASKCAVINRRARMEVIIAVYVTPLINLFLKRRHNGGRTCSNEIY